MSNVTTVLGHEGIVHVTRRTFGNFPQFECAGRDEVAALSEQVLTIFAIADGIEGNAVTKANITVGKFTITASRSEYAQAALVVVAGHPVMKSATKFLRRLVKAPKDWAPAANDAPDDEPRGLEVVR